MTNLTIIADENIPGVRQMFAPLGEVVTVDGRHLSAQQLVDCDILLVRSVTRVDRLLLQGSKVRFVATATIGVDHLDINYLQRAGIGWASAPGCNADSVVDYMVSAFCRLEGVLKQLLAGAVVGIVGMGNVGGSLYRRLSGLGIQCLGYDPLIPQRRYPVLTDLDSVLAADVVCLHTPLTQTGSYPSFHLLDEQRLQQLRPGTVLINAGRGAALDNTALKLLLENRDDICVVLDVWENEPAIDIDLLKRVDLATPHIAGYSLDGKLAGTAMIFQACCQFLNMEHVLPATGSTDAGELLSITINDRYSLVAVIRDAVLASYDIAKDDQRLRGAVFHGLAGLPELDSSLHRSKAFDLLRKNYPVRREFSRYRIANCEQLDDVAIGCLQALGFVCN